MPVVKRFESSTDKDTEDQTSEALLDYQDYCAGLSRRDLAHQTKQVIDDDHDDEESDDDGDQDGFRLLDWGCLFIGFTIMPRLMIGLFTQFVKVAGRSVLSVFRWSRRAKFY